MIKIYISLSLLLMCCSTPDQYLLSDQDRSEIERLRKRYTQAWLDADSAAVMNCLTADAVLIPHHGDPPIEGTNEIGAFWWPPDSAPTRVTKFTSDISEIEGYGDMAYVRGRFQLDFTYDSVHYSNQGNFLNVIVRTDKGWKLSRLIWNDPLPETQL